jgi:hypothetical protein
MAVKHLFGESEDSVFGIFSVGVIRAIQKG